MVILYNLNLLLNSYIEVMIKIITIFNSKNSNYYNNNFLISDIVTYFLHKNINYYKSLIQYARENSLMVKLQSSKLLL